MVGGHRERSRLSARLDAALEDRTRLTLLSAPPGYGKTVAVTGWLASRGLAHAWLSLDPADDDLVRFSRYLAAALQSVRLAAAEGGQPLRRGDESESGSGVATVLEAIATSDDPFALVLDDYHAIASEPIHRLVRVLIERGPPFVHPILPRRGAPLRPADPIPELQKLVAEIIGPLAAQTDVSLKVRVEIEAEHRAEAGFTDQTVRTVSENAKTLRLRDFGFEKRSRRSPIRPAWPASAPDWPAGGRDRARVTLSRPRHLV